MLDRPPGHIFPSAGDPLPPSQRLHLILLGVSNVARSARFYEALGWRRAATSNDGFVKFDLGGYALCLIDGGALAADAREVLTPGFSGVALIHLAKSVEDVPRILAKVSEAGGTVTKPATRTDWGVAGYFKDPDGHLFEVDYEEPWVFDGEHRLIVDPAQEQMNEK